MIFDDAVAAPGIPGQLMIPRDVEKRLGEMQKQIDELRQSVDAFKGKARKASEKPE